VSGWIPVKRRPKNDGWYLVTIPATPGGRGWARHVNVAWWESGRGYGWQEPINYRVDDMPKMLRPTHYMPMPKPARRNEKYTTSTSASEPQK
jgi:hypothetical protein